MNEEIEYAEMLEIPVSTVNMVRKKKRQKREDLKESVISSVNAKMTSEEDGLNAREDGLNAREDGSEFQTYLLEDSSPAPKKKGGKILAVEFAAVCVLCGGIFLTNVFMPNSAINTFFRSFATEKAVVDERTYSEFSLSRLTSEYAEATMTQEGGVVSITLQGCVYSPADGVVSSLVSQADGSFAVEIEYSANFIGKIEGLDKVYYTVGQSVKSNVPIGYSAGERAVQVTLYGEGVLLDCFTMEEGKPVWAESAT